MLRSEEWALLSASHQVSDGLSQLFCASSEDRIAVVKEIGSDFKVPGLKSNKKDMIKYTVKILKTVYIAIVI